MQSLTNHGPERDPGFAERCERALHRSADLVESVLEPWRRLSRFEQVVVLTWLGLLPRTTDIVRLVETLGR
jgi:hypothetical protein